MNDLLSKSLITSLKHLKRLISLLVACYMFLNTSISFAVSNAEVCSRLSQYFEKGGESLFENPSRPPTREESSIIEKMKIELLESVDYSVGVTIVDADNDGTEDLFAWGIQGSGRFVYAELYQIPSLNAGKATTVIKKAEAELGVLQDPRFVRFQGGNYIVFTTTGDNAGVQISQIDKSSDGQYELRGRCQMQTLIKSETKCRHPACKTLADIIDDAAINTPFVEVEWPHRYFSPAGLVVFFSKDWSNGDFDNTNNPTSIWRIGRNAYVNQHIYWALLGQGDQMPEVDSALRPISEDRIDRRVLPDSQHDRLRRTLAQQSEILSNHLKRPISLPKQGEFFLLKANGNRTYWAWDFGEPPYGEEIHLTYTNAKKSDYIGLVRIIRSTSLKSCESNCVTALQ